MLHTILLGKIEGGMKASPHVISLLNYHREMRKVQFDRGMIAKYKCDWLLNIYEII